MRTATPPHLGLTPAETLTTSSRRPVGRRVTVLAMAVAAAIVMAGALAALPGGDTNDDAEVLAGARDRSDLDSVAAPSPVASVLSATAVTTAGPTAASSPTASTAAPAPTGPAPACRNSTDPACGPFRFDPQPGPDRPMTVDVEASPAIGRIGQPVRFRVTLRDPDGVSHGSSTFTFGDAGLGESSEERCAKYGPWDPPAPVASPAAETLDLSHIYATPGTYTATFAFDAEPFACVDRVTGRGDRPYASPARGTATVVVTI